MFGSRARSPRPVVLILVFGVFLVIVGVTAAAQTLLISVHTSSATLNSIVQSDLATLRGFVHDGLDESILDGAGLTPDQQLRLEGLMSTLTSKGEILRVDLRSPSGQVIASTNAEATGGNVAPGAEFSAAAADGQAQVAILPTTDAELGSGTLDTATVLREYLPLGLDGQIVLVVGVWRDAGPFLGALDDLRRDVVLVILTGAAIAAVMLLFIFRAAQGRISRQTTALVEASRLDPLTETLNHGAMVNYLAQQIEVARAAGGSLDVALIDVDNFRLLNDNHGHEAGDEILTAVADVLRAELPEGIVMGRYGPDEFLVIRPPAAKTDLFAALDGLHKEVRALSVQFESTEQLPVTVSVGACSYPRHGASVTTLLAQASRTLEEAKASGGDAVRVAGNETAAEAPAVSSFSVLQGLVFAVDTKDRYTKRHSQDVARYAMFICEQLGMTAEQLNTVRVAGLLHDVGKIGVPDHILRKPGRLTAEEADAIRQHVALGEMITRGLPGIDEVRAGIRYHHERWDGRGYLDGLRETQIPLVARVLAVADAFSAMTTTRPYRKALDLREAINRLGDAAGSQLDESLVQAFTHGLETAANPPLPNVEDEHGHLWVPPRLVA